MSAATEYLLFRLGEQKFALRLEDVSEVARVVAITPLPSAPDVVEGIIDVRGVIVPVVDLRRRFGRLDQELDPDEHLVIARTQRRLVAFRVDEAQEIVTLDASALSDLDPIVPESKYVSGIARLRAGLVLIHDLETLLSTDEQQEITSVLESAHDN